MRLVLAPRKHQGVSGNGGAEGNVEPPRATGAGEAEGNVE